MHSTENYNDIMEQLCQYIKEVTSATGVYAGELTTLKKPIADHDITAPPTDETAPQIIKYIAATEDHAFMKKQYLESNKGVTYSAFKAKEKKRKLKKAKPLKNPSPIRKKLRSKQYLSKKC
jgi:hypothetical protein